MVDYQRRLEGLQARMDEKNLDLVVLGAGPDYQYLTGIGLNWRDGRDLNSPGDAVFVTRDDNPMILGGPNLVTKTEDSWIEDRRKLGMFEDMKPAVKDIVEGIKPKRVGIGEYTWGSLTLAVAAYSGGATFISAEGMMDDLRMIKDRDEIEKLRAVAKLTDEVMAQVIDEIDEGDTMRTLTSKIRHLALCRGASTVSFPPTAGFCKSGSESSESVFNYGLDQGIEPGTAIAFDIGFVLDGYCSDWGRSMYFGEPVEHIEKAYPALMTSVVETIDAMGDEVQFTDEVFDHIEKVCDREGYEPRLRERLPNRMVGHQIGVEVHEDPWLMPGTRKPLVDGMVFCIEPKLWHKGEYYLRVEDMVLMKNGKAESLTTYDRELFHL